MYYMVFFECVDIVQKYWNQLEYWIYKSWEVIKAIENEESSHV